MRLATVRTGSSTTAVILDQGRAYDLGEPDVGALLQRPDWKERAADRVGAGMPVEDLDYAQLVADPHKVICVGHNYHSHIEEMGRQVPTHPSLFAKYADCLTGPRDDVAIGPAGQAAVDWEAELAIVIGAELWCVDEADAARGIAGYSVINDISMRDWQSRTLQWFQGKNWERTTPLGPHLVTPDEVDPAGTTIWCEVDGERVQEATTADLIFAPAALVSYISTFSRLRPGDVIATGTPGGVGHARTPATYLQDGQVVTVGVEGIGTLRNRIRFIAGN